MQPDAGDEASLWDMQRYALQAEALVANTTFEQFLSEPALRLAVERPVEITGEAARRVSSTFQEGHPEIAWRQLIGLRNILAHQYAHVNSETLWQVVREYLPQLVSLLDPLIPEPPADQ